MSERMRLDLAKRIYARLFDYGGVPMAIRADDVERPDILRAIREVLEEGGPR